MDANRSSANAAKRVRIRRSCVGVTGYHQRRWRTPFQLRGYHFTGTPSSSTFARPNGVLLGRLLTIQRAATRSDAGTTADNSSPRQPARALDPLRVMPLLGTRSAQDDRDERP